MSICEVVDTRGKLVGFKEFIFQEIKTESVEFVPLVHAYGEPFKKFGLVIGWKCSHCGENMGSLAMYCPHCGAKLDKQKEA
jgi:uncharacterized OB-fold protein